MVVRVVVAKAVVCDAPRAGCGDRAHVGSVGEVAGAREWGIRRSAPAKAPLVSKR